MCLPIRGVNIFSMRRIYISPMGKIRLFLTLRIFSPRELVDFLRKECSKDSTLYTHSVHKMDDGL
jgi:hypothetical protein